MFEKLLGIIMPLVMTIFDGYSSPTGLRNIAMVRKLRTEQTAQMLSLGRLPDSPLPSSAWRRLYNQLPHLQIDNPIFQDVRFGLDLAFDLQIFL
jgi:hypothetical protein